MAIAAISKAPHIVEDSKSEMLLNFIPEQSLDNFK